MLGSGSYKRAEETKPAPRRPGLVASIPPGDYWSVSRLSPPMCTLMVVLDEIDAPDVLLEMARRIWRVVLSRRGQPPKELGGDTVGVFAMHEAIGLAVMIKARIKASPRRAELVQCLRSGVYWWHVAREMNREWHCTYRWLCELQAPYEVLERALCMLDNGWTDTAVQKNRRRAASV